MEDANLCIYEEWLAKSRGTCDEMIETSTKEMWNVTQGLIGNCEMVSTEGTVYPNCKNQMSHVKFVNLTIEDKAFNLNGGTLIFIGCNLINVSFIEYYNISKPTHIFIILERTNFVCNDSKSVFHLSENTIAKLEIAQSKIIGCLARIQVTDLILNVVSSNISRSNLIIEISSSIRAPTFIRLENVRFDRSDVGLSPTSKGHYLLVKIQDSFFLKSSIEILCRICSIIINKTEFSQSSKKGNGGAVLIKSESVKSLVIIMHSTFWQNIVGKTGFLFDNYDSGFGGALYFGTIENGDVYLKIESCTFENNFAAVKGASLYVEHGVSLYVLKCKFIYDLNLKSAPLKMILYSLGSIRHFEGEIVIKNSKPDTHEGSYEILETSQVQSMKVSVQCPDWYVYFNDFTEIDLVILYFMQRRKIIKELYFQCSPCSDGYYTTSGNRKVFDYPSNQNNSIQNTKSASCIKCPYGAYCSGNNVVPRQNYWGYWHQGELSFQSCPADYCCSGSDEAPCDRFDICAGNRTGALCGVCKEDFSVSILTGKCTPNVECQAGKWFWLFAILLTLFYALWYTFKDDIFGVVLVISKSPFIKKITSKRTQNEPPGDNPLENDAPSISQKVNKMTATCRGGKMLKSCYRSTGTQTLHDINYPVGTTDENIDKGYFGIVTFFVQISGTMSIHIEFNVIDNSKSFLDTLTENAGRFLGIQISELSFDACPLTGLTMIGKNAFKFLFLLGIYVSWLFIFAYGNTTIHFLRNRINLIRTNNTPKSFRLKMVQGLIEIMKYTYSGFCEIIFMSLLCVKLGSDYVWWYDGTNVCLENWQLAMVMLGLVYAVPFPLALLSSMIMLKAKYITAWQFICCCLFEPLAFYYTIKYRYSKKPKHEIITTKVSDDAQAIISVLQGPYRQDGKSLTLYWEAMVSLRRLLITAMTLVGSASIRMMFITGFCITFIIQHIYTIPFKSKQSNHVESFSLFLLSLVSVINLLKASLLDTGTIPTGPSVPFFKGLEFIEDLSLVLLITFIIFVELRRKK